MSRKYNKTFTSLKTVVHDTSILDAQKVLVQPRDGNPNDRTDILDIIDESVAEVVTLSERADRIEASLYGVYESKTFKSNTTGRSNETEGIGIQFSKAHFIPTGVQVRSVDLPYTDSSLNLDNQYCHIQYYNSNNEVIATHISDNTQSRLEANGISQWSFGITNFVPKNYSYVRVLLTSSAEPIAFGRTSEFRINVVNNNGVTFDDDECCVLTRNGGSSNYLGDITVVYGENTGGIVNSVENINSSLDTVETSIFNLETETSRIDNSLTEAYNVLNGKITSAQGSISSLSDTVDELSSSIDALESKNYAYTDTDNTFEGNITVGESVIKSNVINSPGVNASTTYASNALEIGSESLTPSQLKEIKEVVLGTRQRFVSNVDGGIAGEVNAARISNPYFPTGELTHVRIYHNVNHTQLFRGEPLYLYLNVDGTVYHSSTPVTFDTPSNYTDFKFDNVTIPADYTFVDVLMSTRADIEPSYSNRTNCTSFSSLIIMSDVYGNSKVHINQSGAGGEITTPAIIRVATPGTNEEFDTIVDRVDSLETSISERIDGIEDDIENTVNTINNNINNVENDISALETRIDTVEDDIHGIHINETFDTNTIGGGLDNASVTAIQYSKAHFISDVQLNSITIPYTYQSSTASNTGYLYAQIYDNESTIIKSAYSVNSLTNNLSGGTEATFNFTEFFIPKDYRFIRFSFVANTTTVPDIENNVNALAFRCRPIKIDSNVTFDDDDCLCYVNTSVKNWLAAATANYSYNVDGIKANVISNTLRIIALEEKTPDEYPFITEEAAAETYLSKTEASETYLAKEGNNNLAKLDEANTFTAANTFEEVVTINNGAMISGNVFVSNGVLTFEDLVDGTVIESNGATGYRYVEGMPTTFNNGICYDIGVISNETDLSTVTFSAQGRLVQTCELWFTTSATPSTKHKWPTGIYWIDSATGTAPTLLASKNYRLVFRQEPNKIIASIAYLY